MATGVAGQLADTAPAADFSEIGADYAPFSFKVRVNVLAGLCEDAVRVVPSTDFQPVLKGFKVEVGPDQIRLAATDMDLAVVASSPAVTAGQEASVLMPRRLMDILATLDGSADITVDIAGERADITSGTASWSLRLPDGSDYPELPDVSKLSLAPVDRAAFLAALNLVRSTIPDQGGRPGQQQVVITQAQDGGMYLTASNGGRIVRVPLVFPFPTAIPRGAVTELIRQLDHSGESQILTSTGDGNQLVFQLGLTVFTAQPPPAKFPEVEKALLKPVLENQQVLEVSRLQLADAIRRVRITADPSTNAIALQLSPGQCEVIGLDKAGNRARQVLAAKWEGGEWQVIVSHLHLSELLDVAQDETAILRLGPDSGKDKRSPLLYKDTGTGLTAVVSQMQGNKKMLGY